MNRSVGTLLLWASIAAALQVSCDGGPTVPGTGGHIGDVLGQANELLSQAGLVRDTLPALVSLRALGSPMTAGANSVADPWGQTLVYDSAQGVYVVAARPGAPAAGIRFILYAADTSGYQSLVRFPLTEIGYVDAERVNTGQYHVRAEIAGQPETDYLLSGTIADTLSWYIPGGLIGPRAVQTQGTLGSVSFSYADTLTRRGYRQLTFDQNYAVSMPDLGRLASWIRATFDGIDWISQATLSVTIPVGTSSVVVAEDWGDRDTGRVAINGDATILSSCTGSCASALARFKVLAGKAISLAWANGLVAPGIAGLRASARQEALNSLVSVTTATSGTPTDPDGYTVIIDDSLTVGIALNDSIVLPSLPAGSHDVALTGVAANCYVQGYDYAHVVIPGSARIPFNVSCGTTAVRSGQLLVQEDDGLYLIALDGTARTKMPIVGDAAWSPDGSQFAVDGNDGLYLVNADGSGVLLLKQVGVLWGAAGIPAWSSDGARLAYVQCSSYGCDIFSIWPDGTHETKLTDTGHSHCPSWSPDGTELAFLTTGAQGSDLDVVRADGTGLSTLASGVGDCPSWSPDGSHLTFTAASASTGSGEVWVIQSDGNGLVNLTSGYLDCCSQWSPDGSSILFFRVNQASGAAALYLVPPTGGAAHTITTRPDVSPGEWSRDGSRIVFTGGAIEEQSHVYVMDAAGAWTSQVTHDRARDYFWPHLRP